MGNLPLEEYSTQLTLGLLILIFVLLILMILLLRQVQKMKKRLNRFLGTGSDKHDMEVLLRDFLERTEVVQDKYERVNRQIDELSNRMSHRLEDLEDRMNHRQSVLEDRLSFCIQKTGLVRFNPFHDTGGDLSFALALLDEHKSGVVISSIYGRESCYTYGKTVVTGRPSHPLSPEEERALQLALQA